MKIKINENNVIIGYFKLISEKPYKATGCNLLGAITVGKSKFIDNEIINEE